MVKGKHVKRSSDSSARQPLWHTRLAWLGGLMTAVLAGVLVSIVTGLLPIGRLGSAQPSSSPPPPEMSPRQSVPNSPSARKPSRHGKSADTKTEPFKPLKVVSVFPLDGEVYKDWVFKGSGPDPAQIAKADEDRHHPALLNQDFFDDGGYALSTDTQLIVRNRRSYPVSITNIRISRRCQAPVDSARTDDTQPELTDESTQLGFIIDSHDPQAMMAVGSDVSKWKHVNYFASHTVAISAKSVHVFDIRTAALHRTCIFWFQVSVVDGDSLITQKIGDGRLPFRVSAFVPSPSDGHPFAGYRKLYVGGQLSPFHDGTWARENPTMWH
jgi:hypothetical protein